MHRSNGVSDAAKAAIGAVQRAAVVIIMILVLTVVGILVAEPRWYRRGRDGHYWG